MSELFLDEKDIAIIPARKFKRKLHFQPIPRNLTKRNLHTILTSEEWDTIRKQVYRSSHFTCDICGFPEKLECHEVWSFNIVKKVQRLVSLQSLCTHCHATVHGRNTTIDEEHFDICEYYTLANKCTTEQAVKDARKAEKKAFAIECTSADKWKLQTDHVVKQYLKGENNE